MAGARSPCFYSEAQLWSWEWDFSEFGTEELIKLAYDIFIVSGCVAEFGIKTKVGLRFAVGASAALRGGDKWHGPRGACRLCARVLC